MHDDMDKFDLRVKAILESGEEEVPPHIWDAVSARVPSGTRAAAPWWRVAGWSLAAAAVAAAVVFSGLFDRKPPVNDSAALALQGQVASAEVTVSEPALVAESVLDEPSLRGAGSGSVRASRSSFPLASLVGPSLSHPRADMPSTASPSSGTEQQTTESDVQTNDNTATVEIDKAVPAPRRDEEPEAEAKEKKQEGDPFARLAYEDAHKSGRKCTALVLTGLMGSNDGSAQGIHALKIMSTGAYTPKSASGIFESSESVFSVPFSLGAGVRFPITEKLSVGTGLTYSLLERSFSGTYIKDGVNIATNADIRHSLQYVGVPLNVYYDMWHEYGFSMYGFVGGQIEKGISNKYYISTTPEDIVLSQKVQGLQYSVAAGLGMQYDASEKVALYLDPGLRFYFDSGQPKSIRTKKPLMFAFEAGLRFNL